MLHLDRNQHSATISPPLILQNPHSDQTQILSWSAISRDSGHKDKHTAVLDLETSPASTLTPPPDNLSSDERVSTTRPTEDAKVDNASRQSTPLSDLSSPSNREDSPKPEKRGGAQKEEEEANAEDGPSVEAFRGEGGRDVIRKNVKSMETKSHSKQPELPSSSTVVPSHSIEPQLDFSTTSSTTLPNTSIQKSATPSAERNSRIAESALSDLSPSISTPPSATSPASSLPSNKLDTKVVTILELNAELLKAAIEFQSRGIPMSDPRFNQFSVRMQSNLAWMAAAADANRESMNMALPVMHPPNPVDFLSMDRVFQLYAILPTIFANDVTRRNQSSNSSKGVAAQSVPPVINLKRDRNEEMSLDLGNKRRDTGENKISSVPPVPLMNHQAPFPSLAPSVSPPATLQPGQQLMSSSMPPPSQLPPMSPPVPDSRRQNQAMRPPVSHQPPALQPNSRQTSPSSASHSGMSPSIPPNLVPSNPATNGNSAQLAALQSLGPMAVQYYNLLKNPSHPMVQYLINSVPGFQSMPVQAQIAKLHQMQTALQSRNQQLAAQRIGHQAPGMSQQNSQFPNQNASMMPTNPSPTSHQQPMSAQSLSFNNGGNPSIDPRIGAQMMASHQQPSVPGLNALSATQRQLLMMQMRANGASNGAVNPSMLNSQVAVAQERMRQEQHRMSPGAGSPHPQPSPVGSGMDGNQYPMMRSNSTVPGIARSGRSPTDGSPMQARIPSGSQPSAEDIQRAIYAQQQRNMMSQNNTQGYMNPQQMFPGGGSNWQQQQQQQQQQQNSGGMGAQQQGYGMSPPPSAGGQGSSGYGVPSPNPQQWGQGVGPNLQYSYNAALPPAGDRTSATPTPSQQMSHSPPGTMDPSLSIGDFDLFNWVQ